MEGNKSDSIHGNLLHAPGEQEHAVPGGITRSSNIPVTQRAHEYALRREPYAVVRQAYLDGWYARGRATPKRIKRKD